MEISESFILTAREQMLEGLKISSYPEVGPLSMVFIVGVRMYYPRTTASSAQVVGKPMWLDCNFSAPWRTSTRRKRLHVRACIRCPRSSAEPHRCQSGKPEGGIKQRDEDARWLKGIVLSGGTIEPQIIQS